MPDPEPFDIYSDYTTFWMNHWGMAVSFFLQPGVRSTPTEDAAQIGKLLGTVRLSNEHMKSVLFSMARTIVSEEDRTGANYDLTDELCRQMGVSTDQWTSFWNRVREIG